MSTITFGSTTIFNSATTGRGWKVAVSPIKEQAIIERAPQGIGHWIKPNGKSLGGVTLDLVFEGERFAVVDALEALNQVNLYTLTFPAVSGTKAYTNCRLADFSVSFPEGAPDITLAQLVFERFP